MEREGLSHTRGGQRQPPFGKSSYKTCKKTPGKKTCYVNPCTPVKFLRCLMQEVGDRVWEGLCLVVIIHRREVLPHLVTPDLDQSGPCSPRSGHRTNTPRDGATKRRSNARTQEPIKTRRKHDIRPKNTSSPIINSDVQHLFFPVA